MTALVRPGERSGAIQNPLAQKFQLCVDLTDADHEALNALIAHPRRRVRAKDDLIREGEAPQALRLMLRGWACRYKTLRDGRRQIISFFLPGDLCDVNVFRMRAMDHSIGALTSVEFVDLPHDALDALAAHPRIGRALIADAMVSAAIQREWTVSLGQRTALERMAHVFCELYVRLQAVGLAQDGHIEMPLTQTDLGDTIGISAVHVNRTLQELRARGLIHWRNTDFAILDLDGLKQTALFNASYLQFNSRREL